MKSTNYINKKIASGKWITLEEIQYQDKFQKTRTWEVVKRTNNTGAVAMFAIMHPSERIVLVKQFRPPVNGYIFELPAGLIDSGESLESTAIRELEEETGYVGTVKSIIPNLYTSPGLSTETVALALIDIDENISININPKPMLEDTEDIETVLVKRDDLMVFLTNVQKQGDSVDAKLFCLAFGMSG